MTTSTDYKHIVLDSQGRPRIGRANFKVKCLILEHLGNGWGPDELKRQFPDLELAEIHSAFAYYYDHRTEMDEEFERDLAELEACRQATATEHEALRKKLRSRAQERGFELPR